MNPSRRNFLRTVSAAGLGIGTMGLTTPKPSLATGSGPAAKGNRLPREVWVASITLDGFEGQTPDERLKFYVVSSTRRSPSRIIDLSGECLYQSDENTPWVCGPINLEKAVVGRWPEVKKVSAIRRKYGRKLSITIQAEDERMIFESRSPEVRVADVLKEFAIPRYDEVLAEGERMQETYWEHGKL